MPVWVSLRDGRRGSALTSPNASCIRLGTRVRASEFLVASYWALAFPCIPTRNQGKAKALQNTLSESERRQHRRLARSMQQHRNRLRSGRIADVTHTRERHER